MNKKLFGALCLAIACVGAVAYSSQYFVNDSSRNDARGCGGFIFL